MALVPTVSQNIWKFSPQSIPGLMLWLDGADPNTFTYGVSPRIQTWKDKSVNGYNAIQNTTGSQPSVGGGGVVFANPTYMDTTYTAVPTTETVFAVINPTANSGGGSFDIVSTSAAGGRELFIYLAYVSTAPAGGSIRCTTGATIGTNKTTLVEMTCVGATNGSVLEYYNGALQTNTATGTTQFSGAGTTRIGLGPTANISYFAGTIYEILCYNTVLSTQQRQQVEGYLAWKWNLQGSLLATHPYNASLGIMPFNRTFSPIDIPGCQLWLDGGDSNSITTGSTFTWRDKTGNGYDATQSTLATQPTIVTNGVSQVGLGFSNAGLTSLNSLCPTNLFCDTFLVVTPSSATITNTSNFLSSSFTIASTSGTTISIAGRTNVTSKLVGSLISPSGLSNTGAGLTNYVMYGVLTDDWSSGPTSNITVTATLSSSTPVLTTGNITSGTVTCLRSYNILGSNTATGRAFNMLCNLVSPTATTIDLIGNNTVGAGIVVNGTTGLTTTSIVMYQCHNPDGTAGHSSVYFNGVPTGTSQLGSFASGTSIIGSQNTSVPFGFDGTINEIISYYPVLTVGQRNQVEGYLSRKWGIKLGLLNGSQIPINPTHFYIYYPPSTPTPFNPLVLTPVLWLDAADSTTITSSGGSVSQWNDKSGNGKNATNPVNTVTYNLSPINNIPTITFSPNSYLSNTMTYTTTTRNVFAVVTIGGIGTTNSTNYVMIYAGSNVGVILYNYNVSGAGDIEMGYFGKVLLATQSGVGNYNITSILATTNSTGNTGIFVNGSSQALQTNVTGSFSYATGSVTQYIGGYTAAQTTIIGELIVYDGILTTTQRQQVEGYLSQKWRISLPTTHPYYKFSP